MAKVVAGGRRRGCPGACDGVQSRQGKDIGLIYVEGHSGHLGSFWAHSVASTLTESLYSSGAHGTVDMRAAYSSWRWTPWTPCQQLHGPHLYCLCLLILPCLLSPTLLPLAILCSASVCTLSVTPTSWAHDGSHRPLSHTVPDTAVPSCTIHPCMSIHSIC